MTNIYYTAREGRRNACGHTTTRGEVYKITRGDNTLYVCHDAGIDTNGGYYKRWREAVNLIQI